MPLSCMELAPRHLHSRLQGEDAAPSNSGINKGLDILTPIIPPSEGLEVGTWEPMTKEALWLPFHDAVNS